MNTPTTRPPHYLTETEFARLRLTDEQWEEIAKRMDFSLLERNYFVRTYDPSKREKERLSDINGKVAFVLMSNLGGAFITVLILGGIEGVSGNDGAVAQLNNPITFLLAGVAAAWLMARDWI